MSFPALYLTQTKETPQIKSCEKIMYNPSIQIKLLIYGCWF